MGWKIGLPSLKLNNAGVKSKSCGDFGSVAEEALKERKGHDPDIDPERAKLNRYYGFDMAAGLQEYSRKHVEQLRDAKGRKLRKDAVVMCATVLKPPAAYMATLDQAQQEKFLDDAYSVFEEIVGKDNVKARADHFDEQGAHTHVFWEPMTADGRLCAKEVHNLQFFGRVNAELPAKLREKGWDIDDCQMYDAAQKEYEEVKDKQAGRSSFAFKAEAERAKAELEKEIDELRIRAAELRDISAAHEAVIDDKAGTLHLIESLAQYESTVDSLHKTLDMLETAQKGMPAASKLFRGGEAATWQKTMGEALDGLRDVVDAEIKRLQVFEQTHDDMQERKSEQILARKASLDATVGDASQRQQQQIQQKLQRVDNWRQYREIRDKTWETFIGAQRREFVAIRGLQEEKKILYARNSSIEEDGSIVLHSRDRLERDGFYVELNRIKEDQAKHRRQLETIREYERIARERQALVRELMLSGVDQATISGAMANFEEAMRNLQAYAADPDYDFEGRRLKVAQWSLEQAKKRQGVRVRVMDEEPEQSALMRIADEEHQEFQETGDFRARDVEAAKETEAMKAQDLER